MIQVRQSMFETNSSSTDVFCIPSNPSLKIPKEIKMSRLMADTYYLDENASVEDKLSFMYNRAEDNGNASSFIQYLAHKGINVINDVGDTFDYDSWMFGFNMTQENLDAFLFDSNSLYFDSPWDNHNEYERYRRITRDFIVLDSRR